MIKNDYTHSIMRAEQAAHRDRQDKYRMSRALADEIEIGESLRRLALIAFLNHAF
jgi:hypothetical protein